MTSHDEPVDEGTHGRKGSREAVEAAQRSSRQVDTLISDIQRSLSVVRESRNANHYTDKFRTILRGRP